jgi:hypothetical protein
MQPHHTPIIVFIETVKTKMHMEAQRPRIAKAILSKIYNDFGIIADFKLCYRAIVIKIA